MDHAEDRSYRYQTVEHHINDLISSGALTPGDRLPSLRALSSRMKASISTISQAYIRLEHQGTIEARPRSGFFVSSPNKKLPPPAGSPRPVLEPTRVNRNQLIRTVLDAVGDQTLLPFAIISPAKELLPHKALGRIMRRVLKNDNGHSLTYAPCEGNADLRRQICFRSIDAGISVLPRDILITFGAMEGLHIALRALTRPGDNVLVQSPTYFCFLQLLENCGLRAIEVPSHPETGVDPADVALALETFHIRAGILSSNFNNPDGSLTPEPAKKTIVDLFAKCNIPLIEDDVSGELHFGNTRPGTYKQHDRKGDVLYCSSFSKTLAPGYRVGWIIPGKYHPLALELKATTSVCTATPTQMVLAEYLESGQYDRHLRKLRQAIATQMRTMQVALSRYFPPDTRATRPAGGAVLWVELPKKIDAVDYFFRAKNAGIGIAPGSIFSTQDNYNSFIRLSCDGLWNTQMEAGIQTLGRIAGEMTCG
ncbi:MAG: PLP-dependent aminotransferase family protein [Desulfoplanes sp.]|nr:PLP-dependent aminotransferase family protein [Desulfoplanes sp.]